MKVSLLVFARSPMPGRTKTRLIPALGREGAAQLHAALVRDTLDRAVAADTGRVELWAADADEEAFLQTLAGMHGISVHEQRGTDLGERMAGALAQSTDDGRPAMVIGCDCPTLSVEDIRAAAGALRHNDAVLVPAHDGGYVLIGLHSARDELFNHMPWGSDQVLAETRRRLAQSGWSWAELPPRADVDRPEDLAALRALGRDWARLCNVPETGAEPGGRE